MKFKIFSILIIITFIASMLMSFINKNYFLTNYNINQHDIYLHLRYLSNDNLEGRYPDSMGSKLAKEWIIRFYKKNNLIPLFDGSYIQEFSFLGKFIKSSENYFEILSCKENCKIPFEPIPTGKTGIFTGKVLFAEYCIEEQKEISQSIIKNNIKKTDEIILICKRYGNKKYEPSKNYQKWISFENKYKNIDKFGFMGVIFLKDKGDSICTDQIHFSYSSKNNPFAIFVDNEKYDINDLQNGDTIKVIINYQQERLKGHNLGSSLKPIQPDQKIIYVGAHYDHLGKGIPKFSLDKMGKIYNGADDNASGTVGVLEIAEYFSHLYKKKPDFLPQDWNIVFLHFDAEEWGLYGSEEFVKSKYFLPNSIFMMNFDMIGRYENKLYIQGIDTGDENWKEILNQIKTKYQESFKIIIEFTKGGSGPSDHSVFYRKKMPILFFFTGTHQDYHKPTDDYDKINYEKMAIILNLAKDIVLEIVNKKLIPEYKLVKEERQNYSFKVRLGIIPKNYFSREGIEIGGFVEGAPIQKSGVQIGDIIIQIDTFSIKSIYDLMDFLKEGKLNKKYKLIYKRDNKIYETYIELME